jgi:phosphorylcholine metabolism protein LicD
VKNLKSILEYADNLFKENGIKYWLDYGTLLGAVRERSLIEYDTDIDVGILYEDKGKLISLKHQIEKDSFFMDKDPKLDFYRINFSKINTLHMDIFLWIKRENGELYRSEYMPKDRKKGKDFASSKIQNMELAEIEGRFYPVPENPEKFCEFRFGENWRKRIKE